MKIDDVSSDAFTTHSSGSASQLDVRLVGCLDMEAAPLLDDFLSRLLGRIERAGSAGAELRFECQELYLMSSASISCFARWLKRVKASGAVASVQFRTNPRLAWQQRTMDSIRLVAEGLVSVEARAT